MTGQVECDGLTKESANTLTRHLARECQHVRIHACWNAGAMHGATGASRLAASCGWVPVVNRCRPLGGGAGSEWCGAICILHQLNQLFPNANVVHFTLCRTRSSH